MEQACDSSRVDIRADIYSLGCTLYFLLTGHMPFPEGSAMQKVLSHMDTAPNPVEGLRQDVPADLAAILDGMMAKNPDSRFQTPAEVAQALAPFAKGSTAARDTQAGQLPSVDTRMDLNPQRSANEMPALETGDFEFASEAVNSPGPGARRKPRFSWQRSKVPVTMALVAIVGLAAAGLFYSLANKSLANKPGSKQTADLLAKRSAGLPRQGVAPPFGSGKNPGNEPARPRAKETPTLEDASRKARAAVKSKSWRVLYLIAPRDFWYPDYGPVRRVLEEQGVKLLVASSRPGPAKNNPGGGGKEVPVDVLLREVAPDDFDAIIVGGGRGVQEFLSSGTDGRDAATLIRGMWNAGKRVTALCLGTGVLAEAGVLRDKRATGFPWIEAQIRQAGAIWVNEPVVVDPPLITARDPAAAEEFARTLVRQLREGTAR